MGFPLSDLIIESIFRDGFENLRRNPAIIDDIFSQLVSLPPSLAWKYGEKEINKIKELVSKKEVSIIQAFPVNNTPMPAISIQLLEDPEEIPLAVMNDSGFDLETPMTPQQLAAQISASNVELLSYDPNSGILLLGDTADLSKVHPNQTLTDAGGNQFQILGGINNIPGQRQVIIPKGQEVDLAGPATIASSINYNQFEIRTNSEQETLLIGIHSKEPLITKYLYTLIKYFIESRKADLINRGFMLPTYKGADFNANKDFEADQIFTRYITITGKIYNTWNSDQVIPIDWIDVQVTVPRAEASNEDLGLTDQTIQVEDDDFQS